MERKNVMESFITPSLLENWAGQLRMNATALEVSKKYMPPEEAAEFDQLIARGRELAEQVLAKANEPVQPGAM